MWTRIVVIASILAAAFAGIGIYSWFAYPSIAPFVLLLMTFIGVVTSGGMIFVQAKERPRFEAMRIGIGPEVLYRIFRTTTEEFRLNTFHRVRVVADKKKYIRKIELYGGNNTVVTIMDFDDMNEMYEQLSLYLPKDVQLQWITQRVDTNQPIIVGVILVIALSVYFIGLYFVGFSITDVFLGVFQIVAAFTLWRYKPSTRINPEYQWLERFLAILFLILGFSRIVQAYFL